MKKVFILFFALFALSNLQSQVVIYEGHIENCLAGESMVAPVWVYISSSDGKMYKANATTTSNPAVGLVFASVTSGNTGQIAFSGYFEWPSATFTPGQAQYLSAATSGAMTTTAPTNVQKLGYSVTSGRFKIDPQPFVASGGGGGGSDYLGTGFTSGGGSGSIPNSTTVTLGTDFILDPAYSGFASDFRNFPDGDGEENVNALCFYADANNWFGSARADGDEGRFQFFGTFSDGSDQINKIHSHSKSTEIRSDVITGSKYARFQCANGEFAFSSDNSAGSGYGEFVMIDGSVAFDVQNFKIVGTSNAAILDPSSIATSDKTFTFPNQTATFNTITSSTGAPASTPVALGQTYIDTDADAAYISTGTGSSADYKMITRPYKIYVANITQSTTGAPSATVLENTLGVTPTWARSSTGVYTLTATGVWTTGKTTLPDSRVFLGGDDQDEVLATRWVRTSADVLTMLVLKTNLALESNVEMNTSEEGFTIRICVYP